MYRQSDEALVEMRSSCFLGSRDVVVFLPNRVWYPQPFFGCQHNFGRYVFTAY